MTDDITRLSIAVSRTFSRITDDQAAREATLLLQSALNYGLFLSRVRRVVTPTEVYDDVVEALDTTPRRFEAFLNGADEHISFIQRVARVTGVELLIEVKSATGPVPPPHEHEHDHPHPH